jgi:hypothetical protein
MGDHETVGDISPDLGEPPEIPLEATDSLSMPGPM